MNSSVRACLAVAFVALIFDSPPVVADEMPINVFHDWSYYNDSGWRSLTNGDIKRAEGRFRKAIEVLMPYSKSEPQLLARSYHDLAWTLHAEGRETDAEPLAEWALQVREKFQPDTKALAQNMNTLAVIYVTEHRYEDAESLYGRAVPIWELSLGADHPGTAAAHHDLATVLSIQRKFAAAEPHFKRAIYIYEQLQNAGRRSSLSQTAYPKAQGGRRRSANQGSAGDPGASRADPQGLAASLVGLARNYALQTRYADAEPLLKRAIDLYDSKALPEDDVFLAAALEIYSTVLHQTDRAAEAAPLEARAKAIRAKVDAS
jgi:tetratricopeptide (TPR) repeat protein